VTHDNASAFPMPNPATHYAVRETAVHCAKGGILRAVRRERGLDVGSAARALKMPVTSLIQIELGSAEFVDGANYRRAVELLRGGRP
jgi:hypothetical protein